MVVTGDWGGEEGGETEEETERCEETKWEVESQSAVALLQSPHLFLAFILFVSFLFIFILILPHSCVCAGTASISASGTALTCCSTLPSPYTGSPDLGFFYYFFPFLSLSLSLPTPAILHVALVACMKKGKMEKWSIVLTGEGHTCNFNQILLLHHLSSFLFPNCPPISLSSSSFIPATVLGSAAGATTVLLFFCCLVWFG